MSEFPRTLALVAIVASMAGLAPHVARAQEEQRVDEEARGLFLAGRAAFSDGRWQEALEHFQHAYELSPRPGLLYNIGQTADRMRNDEIAVDAFERFLQASPDAPNRGAIESRLAVLRHAIAERQASDRQAEEVRVEREAEPLAVPAAPSPARSSILPPVLTLAGGGLVAVAGGVLLMLAKGAADDVTAAEEGTPWVDVRSDYDSSGSLGLSGGVLLGVGAAVLTTGVLWLVLRGAGSGHERLAVAISPTGAALRGSF